MAKLVEAQRTWERYNMHPFLLKHLYPKRKSARSSGLLVKEKDDIEFETTVPYYECFIEEGYNAMKTPEYT